jgi:hypothetical protein
MLFSVKLGHCEFPFSPLSMLKKQVVCSSYHRAVCLCVCVPSQLLNQVTDLKEMYKCYIPLTLQSIITKCGKYEVVRWEWHEKVS